MYGFDSISCPTSLGITRNIEQTLIERFTEFLLVSCLVFYYSDGPHLRNVNYKDTFCEHPLKDTHVAFKAEWQKLISVLTSALENRFSDCDNTGHLPGYPHC